MAKKKKVLKDWSYSTKLESRKSNKDISFNYKITDGIKLKSILASAWIYTNNPDKYEATIKCVIKINNETIYESPTESTTDGTAWSSCEYTFDELIEEETLNISTVGNNFKKGLNITLQGFIDA